MMQFGLLAMSIGFLVLAIPMLMPKGLKVLKPKDGQPAKYFSGPPAVMTGIAMIILAAVFIWFALFILPHL